MEDKIPNGIPPFYGSNFEYWSNSMETYLKSLGVDVWFSVALGYSALKNLGQATRPLRNGRRRKRRRRRS
jgi:hypothetical protein